MNISTGSLGADTRPTKQVIHDLTKDITTEDCIFDLIDNSIEAFGKELSGFGYKSCKIELFIERNTFTIKDEAVGISREVLEKSALRFGSIGTQRNSIGVFGVGLNRALFKLGKDFKVTSETDNERLSISLNTREYFSHDNWHVPINKEEKFGKTGTVIEIMELTDDSSKDFSNSIWLSDFKYHIKRRYEKFLSQGLEIEVNKSSIEGQSVEIRNSDFPEMDNRFYDGEVEININVGQHQRHRFNYEVKDSKGNEPRSANKDLTKEYGWTVYCNGRAVLFSDTTKQTGIKTKFHSQYYGFVGKVSFTGPANSLPWNTTKTGVDLNNATYQKALEKMEALYASWRSHTDLVKKGKFDKQDQLPLSGISSEPNSSNTNESQSQTHNVPPHPFDRLYLFGNKPRSRLDFKIPSSEIKLSAVVTEISGLLVNRNPFSIALLLRVFIELSLKYFQEKNSGFQPKKNLSLREKVIKCTDFMESKGFLESKHEIDGVKSLCAPRGEGVITIEYLQKTIHCNRSMLEGRSLLAFWNDIHPFIRACFSNN